MSRNATRQLERSGFALALHTALSDASLTTEAFARQVGVTLRTAQRWRNGEGEPGAEEFSRILRELGRDASYFYPAKEAA